MTRCQILWRTIAFAGMSMSACATVLAAPAAPATLDELQVGQVRHIIDLSRQQPNAWNDMGPEIRYGFDGLQYQLAFMSYTLGIVQNDYTPAYRELYRKAQLDLIDKMIQFNVFGAWNEIIVADKYKPYLQGAHDWRDPVGEKNIMYSGHLLQMIALYQFLYNDDRFDKPDSIKFTVPMGPVFKYNLKTLAENIHRQFVEQDYVGIECEPNDVFSECNQHPILGLIHYDWTHGTSLADVRVPFKAKLVELKYIDEDSGRTMLLLQRKENKIWRDPFAWSDGWNGVMMHGWDKPFVDALYAKQRDASLVPLLEPGQENWPIRWGNSMVSFDFGFLAAYAAEVGDHQTVDRMLAFADKNFRPRWNEGAYFYPRHDVAATYLTDFRAPAPNLVPAEKTGQYQVGPLTGNALLAFARINRGDGLWRLYNVRDNQVRTSPVEVADVKYPEVLVNRAIWDDAAGALDVRVSPGTSFVGKTALSVRGLGQATYSVLIDGKPAATLSAGSVRGNACGCVSAEPGGGVGVTIRISFDIDAPRRIQIVKAT